MALKKIIHITGVRELTSGQRQQLISENNASSKIEFVEWKTLAFHTGDIKESFEKPIPVFFRPLFLRNLYVWLKVLSYKEEYDIILLRHMTFDPFAVIFSIFIKNRISVHHAKEISELKLIREGWKGELASRMEKIVGKISIKNAIGVAGVTKEIAMYENFIHGVEKPLFFYPNGVDFNHIGLAKDFRKKNEINIVFICGKFSDWHGLDLILNASEGFSFREKINIHLIGSLTAEQVDSINNNKNSNIFFIHGVLSSESYIEIMSRCDIGLSSLALYRKDLKEASTLKVREMLAMGLPVYSSHIDGSLINNSDHFYCDMIFNFDNLIEFALEMKKVSRETVREESYSFISKEKIMERFLLQIDKKYSFLDSNKKCNVLKE